MSVQVAANVTKTRVFNYVMKHRPMIRLSESSCEFFSTLGLLAWCLAHSPVAIVSPEGEREYGWRRFVGDFPRGARDL